MRRLIINADDFGRSPGINQGIVACHRAGVVSSASLMVRWPAATEAATLAQQHPALSVGLHIDLGEWSQSDGEWRPLYEVAPRDDEQKIRDEILRQFDAFDQLMGCTPTHIDSHQHVHREGPAHRVAVEMASRFGVPLRKCHPRIRYDGRFYGQDRDGHAHPEWISVDALIRLIETLPEGITEIGCHPALGGDVDGMYGHEREVEVGTLCDPRIRAALEKNHIALMSFRDLAALRKRSRERREGNRRLLPADEH